MKKKNANILRHIQFINDVSDVLAKTYARDQMLVCNNIVSIEDISVLANGTNNFRTKLQESF